MTVLAKLMPPLAVALALTGCGIQAATPPGGVSLTVTRDFGAGPVLDQPSPRRGGDDTVLRLLRRNASVRTRGGGSVASIDGLAGVWSAYVNGVAASRRAGDVHVHEGDRIWLDRHAAPADARVRAVVGAFPEPFLHGSGGKRLPVRVECGSGARPACRAVADALGKAGVVAGQSALGPGVGPEVLRVLVGPWGALRADSAAQTLERGPRASGVYARMSADGRRLAALDEHGSVTRRLGAGTGLVAATRVTGQQPTWIVTGTDPDGLDAAVRAFADGESALAGKFALAVRADRALALPVIAR